MNRYKPSRCFRCSWRTSMKSYMVLTSFLPFLWAGVSLRAMRTCLSATNRPLYVPRRMSANDPPSRMFSESGWTLFMSRDDGGKPLSCTALMSKANTWHRESTCSEGVESSHDSPSSTLNGRIEINGQQNDRKSYLDYKIHECSRVDGTS